MTTGNVEACQLLGPLHTAIANITKKSEEVKAQWENIKHQDTFKFFGFPIRTESALAKRLYWKYIGLCCDLDTIHDILDLAETCETINLSIEHNNLLEKWQ